jgi:hypothetical protein
MKSTISLAGEIHDYDTEIAIAMPPECHRALRVFLRSSAPPFRVELGRYALDIRICWVGIPEASFADDGTITLKASRRNLNQLILDLEDLSIPNHPLDHFHMAVTGDSTRRNLQAIVFERSGDDEYAKLQTSEELVEGRSR